jgi:hypothetical protein
MEITLSDPLLITITIVHFVLLVLAVFFIVKFFKKKEHEIINK